MGAFLQIGEMKMRRLTPAEMNIAAGGSAPALVCNTTESSTSVSGNTATSHSTVICQTSSGLTIITTTDTVTTSGEFSLSGLFKGLVGGEVKGEWSSTTTDVTTCKPNGECTTVHKETATGSKSADAADGASVEGTADNGGDNSACGDGGAWAGGESGGGDVFDELYEMETC
ncbi:MAG TPA: hypothetical protein VFS95_01150 [Telluria sp.]|nr:hypothetical protein [Telluria sp.]